MSIAAWCNCTARWEEDGSNDLLLDDDQTTIRGTKLLVVTCAGGKYVHDRINDGAERGEWFRRIA